MRLLLEQVLYSKKENNKKKIIDKNFHQQHDHAKQVELVMFDFHLIYQHHEYLNPFLIIKNEQTQKGFMSSIYRENHMLNKLMLMKEVFLQPNNNQLVIAHLR